MKRIIWILAVLHIAVTVIGAIAVERRRSKKETEAPNAVTAEELHPAPEHMTYEADVDEPRIIELKVNIIPLEEAEHPEDGSDTDELQIIGLPDETEPEKETEVDPHQLEMLACCIYKEAGGDACSDETRMMVGNVVLNRVADSRYPDTMEDVLTQEGQYNTFAWTGIVWPEAASTDTEAAAVERAYDCAHRLLTGERVLPEDVIFQAEFQQGQETVAISDGIYFCR